MEESWTLEQSPVLFPKPRERGLYRLLALMAIQRFFSEPYTQGADPTPFL
jgi:hypothetical protein